MSEEQKQRKAPPSLENGADKPAGGEMSAPRQGPRRDSGGKKELVSSSRRPSAGRSADPKAKPAVSKLSPSGKKSAGGPAAASSSDNSAASESEENSANPLLKVCGKTCTGPVRKINQDSILINKKISLFAVADGMGGHTGGEVASASAVSALDKFLSLAAAGDDFSPSDHLLEGFREANAQVFQKSRENNGELMGMGTTLVACLLHGKTAYFANVGDSRAYLFRRPSRLWRITEDHSILNMQMKRGLIQQDKADLFSESNVITRSIGFVSEVETDLFQRDILPGDVFLLCSDGLNEASESDLCEIFQNREPGPDLIEALIDKALQAGGHDNISAVVIAP